jgi:OPT oligopeptide transporter protein
MASRFVKRWLPQPEGDTPTITGTDGIASIPPEVIIPSSELKDDGLKTAAVEVGEEKVIPGSPSSVDESFADDDPTIRDIPFSVRRVVSLEDDPTLPTITFRYFVLTIPLVVLGAFCAQLSHFRTTYVPFSVFFVQIVSNYLGIWLAKVLPSWNVKIPFTSYGFNLNPGPWSVKEHVLVSGKPAGPATRMLC